MKTSQPPAALPRHIRGALMCGVIGALLATASPSFAEGAADEALTSTLFIEGRALMEAGDHARACPKFVEAQRLHSATGTARNVADCWYGPASNLLVSLRGSRAPHTRAEAGARCARRP